MMRILSFLILSVMTLTAAAAKVDTVTIATTNLETPMTVIVVSPENARPGEHFPTAYVLHGYAGDYGDWLTSAPHQGYGRPLRHDYRASGWPKFVVYGCAG